ncbi:MAG TPA: SBBP repeat-containing protein [Verrucomicrobiae bacterium]|nr:SBBP repeat-containing protein [Verrucomicrobiae bacterium]
MCSFAKKISALLFFGFLAFPVLVFCQVDTAWVRYFNGVGDKTDEMRGLAVDDSGNVVVTGHSGTGTPSVELVTIKYDRNGNQLWLRNYNGVVNTGDYPNLFAMDKNGNVYVTGGTSSENDCLTIKYGSNGNQVWATRYNGPINGVDIGIAVTADENGNVYATGISQGASRNCGYYSGIYYDFVTIKYNSSGNQLWAERYVPPGGDAVSTFPHVIGVDSLGNVYVGGYSNHCQGPTEWVSIKYDSTGTQLWVRSDIAWSVSNSIGSPIDLKLDDSGNIYLTGASRDSVTFLDYTTVKYDSGGNLLWVARFNGSANHDDFATAMVFDSQNNIYVTGFSYAGAGNQNDIVTVKYDSDGNELWARSYNGPGSGLDRGFDISSDSAENIYVAGVSFGIDSTYNYVILKYDSNGNFLWEKRYAGPVFYYAFPKISVDRNGNVYLAGSDLQNQLDYVTIKYSPLPALKGDLNLDGVMTLADVVLMLNFAFNGAPFPAAPSAGDLNCDGKISPADVVVLLLIFYASIPPPC